MKRKLLEHCKSTLSFMLALTMLLAVMPAPAATAAAASGAIRITMNGRPVISDVAPFIDANGRTMVPVRFIAEALDADVRWDDFTSTVAVHKDFAVITLQIGSRELTRNNRSRMMDTEAVVVADRTFVPVRFIAEAMGLTVDWNEATNTVILTTGGAVDLESYLVSTGKEVYHFNTIVEYNGKVYSIYAAPEIPNFTGVKGSTKLTPLPAGIGDYLASSGEELFVYSFTIYQDKIYYLAAEPGSDITSGVINRCNLDGSQHELLTYANNYSTCMISDGWLYSDGETDGGDFITCTLSLNSPTFNFFQVDFPENIDPGIVLYNGFIYYFSDSTLYKKDIQNETQSGPESASSIMTNAPSPMNVYNGGFVIAVVNDTVYYATAGEYSDNGAGGNTYLFGVSIYGGTPELLATWFAS